MFRVRILALSLSFLALSFVHAAAQEDSGWRISPEKINILVDADRPLQLLDDSAQELHGALWFVDDSNLAEIQQEGDHVVVHAKAAGTVRITAALGSELRSRGIRIWPTLPGLPQGTINWGMHPIGREIGDLPAVPTGDGPDQYSLEQTASGNTYLRAVTDDGIQVWNWLMPDKTQSVELVCGDWLGGAVISAKHAASYTLYVVGKDGKLRWQHTAPGMRKGLAISLDHVVYLLTQSQDGTVTSLKGLDESSGALKFEHLMPSSRERRVSVQGKGDNIICASDAVSTPIRTSTSGVSVNMDGLAYVAFTHNTRTLGIEMCTPNSKLNSAEMYLEQDDNLILWQVHPDGTYRSTVVEAIKRKQPVSAPLNTALPTSTLTTDNMNGMLIPVQWSHQVGGAADEFIYRVAPDGEVLYKFSLPKYTGSLHDGIVIASNDVAFATRGSTLIAFSVRSGENLWRWESPEPEISVFAALANGHCLVQTPTALVEVENSASAKLVVKGKVMMGWHGKMFLKHN